MCRRGSWSNPGETGARCNRLAPGKEECDGVSVDRCVDRGFEEFAPGFAELVGVSPFSNKDTRALTHPGERRTGGAAGPPLENREQKTENRERPTSGRRVERWEMWRVYAARLSQRTRRTTKVHKELTGIGTADFADLLQIKGVLAHADCQNDWLSQRTRRSTKRHKGRRRGGPCVCARHTSGPGA